MNSSIGSTLRGARFAPGLVATLLLIVVAACNGEARLESAALDRTLVIDGATTEWDGALVYFEKQHASIGLRNDGDNLWVALYSSDEPTTRQALNGGLTLWLDPDGKDERRFGIRFPRGIDPDLRGSFIDEMRESANPDSLLAAFAGLDGEMEIIDEPGEPGRILPSGADGVEVAARFEHGELFYEAKVPLVEFAATGGTTISIGLEGTAMRRDGRGPRGGGPGGMGGRPGEMGGGRGGFPGGGPPGGGFPGGERTEPLDLWFQAALSGGAAQ